MQGHTYRQWAEQEFNEILKLCGNFTEYLSGRDKYTSVSPGNNDKPGQPAASRSSQNAPVIPVRLINLAPQPGVSASSTANDSDQQTNVPAPQPDVSASATNSDQQNKGPAPQPGISIIPP
jgi:hypothetical protein